MSNEKNTMEIEINGVKMEIDTRYAKRIDQLKVGDRVKVLNKSYSDYKVSHGVIIGFEPFKELPTIIIAHIEIGYSSTDVKFIYYNANSKDVEIVPAVDDDQLGFDKEMIIKNLDSKIAEKHREIEDIKEKKEYFLSKFKTYWASFEGVK